MLTHMHFLALSYIANMFMFTHVFFLALSYVGINASSHMCISLGLSCVGVYVHTNVFPFSCICRSIYGQHCGIILLYTV